MERISLSGLNFFLYFFPTTARDELTNIIVQNGGKISTNFREGCLSHQINSDKSDKVTHFLTTEQKLLESSYQIKQAEKMGVPVLTSQW